MSLAELTDRMEENNRSTYEIERHTRNSRAHLLDIKKNLSASVGIQASMSMDISSLVGILTGNALAQLEKDREMMRLLEGLGGNGDGGAGEPPDFTLPNQTVAGLGLALGAIALAIGGGLGLIQGQIAAIKAYTKALVPGSFTKMIDDMKASWSTRIANVKTGISTRITALGTSIGALLDDLKLRFAINPETTLGKAIARIKGVFSILGQRIQNIIKPIVTVSTMIGETIRPALSKVRLFFTGIGNKVKLFGNIVKRIAGIVGKVFAPIAIVTTAWATITGFIEGWKEDGILGGLEGAITGFFTSLVTIPLDLVKDAVAWVLKKFGWDEEAEALKSFSFTDLFKKAIGAVFDVFKGAINWVKTLFTDPVKAIKDLWNGVYGEDGIINTIVWKPISKVINWVMEKFGWKDDDPNAPDFDLYTFVKDTWKTVVDKVKAGFKSFGNWIASLPAQLKLFAYETIRKIPVAGERLISDEKLASAEAAVAAFNVPMATSGSEIAFTEADIADTIALKTGGAGPPGTGGNSTVQLGGDSLTVATGTPKAASSESGLPQDIYGGYGNMTLEQIQAMSGG
jgi:hypothetical protein